MAELETEDMGALQPQAASVPTEKTDSPASPVWQWYASRNEEDYLVGPEDTRQAVIQAATEDFDGEPFHIVEACKGSMSRYLPNAEQVIEWMTERADDDGAFGEGEYCELVGSEDAISAAEGDLRAALEGWFERHGTIFPTPWVFLKTRNGEWVTPEADTRSLGTKSQSDGVNP